MNIIDRERLIDLWFIYGNRGTKHTKGNHKFIQSILEHGEYRPDYQPTDECKEAVDELVEV